MEAYLVEVLRVLRTHVVVAFSVADHRAVWEMVDVGAEGAPVLHRVKNVCAEASTRGQQTCKTANVRHEHDRLPSREIGVDLGGVDVADVLVHPADHRTIHVIHVNRKPAEGLGSPVHNNLPTSGLLTWRCGQTGAYQSSEEGME